MKSASFQVKSSYHAHLNDLLHLDPKTVCICKVSFSSLWCNIDLFTWTFASVATIRMETTQKMYNKLRVK